MANGKIINKTSIQGSISSPSVAKASVTKGGGGTFDHNRLLNCDLEDQHPIEAITGLRVELDSKLNAGTALPLIEDAVQNKAKGLYFDALKELARKPYWYLTSEVDPITKMGTKDSIISGPYDLGMGGGSGGGGGGVTTVRIKQVGWPAAATVGNSSNPTKIKINWSSVIGEDQQPTGTGTVYLIVNGKQVATYPKQAQGDLEFDISNYIISGDNNVQVKILDMYGTTGTTVGVIEGISLELKSNFNQETAYYGKIDFTYTPIGNADKKVYFIIDEDYQNAKTEIVKSSNELQTYEIYGLSHGAHTLRVYFEATIGEQVVSSNSLFYDIIFVEENNLTPIIASEFDDFEQEQYISFRVPYRVFINNKSMAVVTLKANGKVIRTSEVATNGTHVWAYRSDDFTIDSEGNTVSKPITLEIICENVSKVFSVNILESKITVTPVLNNLELALSANGRSNDEVESERNVWSYTTIPPAGSIEPPKTYSCIFENFNWSSDGWLIDQSGTSMLSVGGAARVIIPLEIFNTNFISTGKTIELEIATRGIRDYNTTIISCLDKTDSPFYEVTELYEQEETRLKGYKVSYTYSTLTNSGLSVGKHLFTFNGESWTLNGNLVNLSDYGITLESTLLNVEGEDVGEVIKGDRILVTYSNENRGIKVTPQVASIRSQQSFLSTQYKEDEHVRITFVIEPNTADMHRIIWMYINGVASGAMQYPTGDDFAQKTPSYITIGSSEAIVDIYNIRVYNAALTNRQVVNNWIADTPDAAEKAYRFSHNQVLNEQDQVTPASLLIGAPDLPYIIWDIDPLPQSKEDVRPGNADYVDPTDSTRNFTAIDAEYKVQGTSSSVYPTKNIRLRMKKGKGGPNLEWFDEEGNDLIIKNGGKGFPITYPGGIGVDYFTFKVDYASSEGANNVELTKLYNDASIKYGLLTPPQQQNSQIRVGIDGFPIVAFHKNDADEISFCTKANFNNDKSNPDVYGFDKGDESWETTNNSAAEARYQLPVTVENFDRGFEIRYPDEDDYNDMSKLGPMTAWVYSTYREKATNEAITPVTYPSKTAIINNKNEENKTFVYNYETKTNDKGEPEYDADGNIVKTLVSVTFTHDSSDYRLNKFKHELADWFNVDSCLFYYLFTELFLMIDSRAKNAFPTYFATRTKTLAKDEDGNNIPDTYTDGGNRWYWIPYDMDTAIGIDNKGKLSFDYYLEDIDQLDGTDVYNGQTSVMWCNVRDAFHSELAAMYLTLRNQGLLSYDEVERRFTEHQSKWPEVILNLDAHNKYIVPLDKGDNYLEMLQGTKEQQRKWWLYNRFKYIDSKYNAGDAKADFIQFRAYVDVGVPKPDLHITPYANIYATASFGNNLYASGRVINRGESITLKNPFGLLDDENDQETYIYSASQLKSIGDISGFQPDTVKIGNAIRLQDLKVGDASPDYKNYKLLELTVGANTLLKSLDARNCVNLGTGTTVAPDLSQCTNIEEIYFTGTKIKGITLPDGGTIKKLHLPGTLTALTIQNHPLLEELVIESTNTTITKSSTKEENYSFSGLVVKKDRWNDTTANADLYLADSIDENAHQIRVSIVDKNLYNTIVEGESVVAVSCSTVDFRYDLLDDTTIELAEYSTRFIKSITVVNQTVTTVELLLAEAESKITAPTLEEFKESLIEQLWLEGIPSKAIKAKEFIKNMKKDTRVSLIGINETYNSWEEVKEFYDLLDRHHGIDKTNSGRIPEKPQVTGIINIDEISYAKYIELTSRYPEITINAKRIICTITFYNEGKLHYSTNIDVSTTLDNMNKLVLIGQQINFPEVPVKTSTQANYYIFNSWKDAQGNIWDSDSFIAQNLDLIATYDEKVQQYSVIFNPSSDIISIDPTEAIYYYGDKIIPPTILTDLTELNVELEGWKTINGESWDFNNGTITGPLELVASWKDENIPTIQLFRENYNTFRYEATDNLGIIGWAVVKDSAEEPTEWNYIKATTSLKDTYTINSAGEYYFWITDSKNVAFTKLIADKIIVSTTPGIVEYTFTEGEHTFESDFALRGTTLKLNTVLDDHYENLEIYISGTETSLSPTFTVDNQSKIDILCGPKDYTVSFNLSGKGDSEKAPEQLVTYLHYVDTPAAQYWQASGEVLDSWYLDPNFTQRWDFETDQVTGDTILYAKWVSYHRPSILTIEIPEDGDRYIYVNYSQYNIDSAHKVLIDWGDNSTNSSSTDEATIRLGHEYAKAGTYQISIWGPGGGNATYLLGNNISYNIINPIEYLVDIELSWDVARLAPGAFRGSSLKTPKITQYMSEISTDCYANCSKLEEIIIPDNIMIIEDQAFSACRNAKGSIVIPNSIKRIGTSAFANCDSITRFELLGDSTPILANEICRGDIGLKEIAISEHLTIPYRMFSWCSGLEQLTINNKLENNVFESCAGLKELVSNSTSFGDRAFIGCYSLEKVVLTNPNLVFGDYTFDGCPKLNTFGPLSDGEDKYDFSFAWETEIPAKAFQRSWDADSRKSVKEVTLPKKLLKIGELAFHNATTLSQILVSGESVVKNWTVLPSTLREIDTNAFESCTSLRRMEIPATVDTIGPRAFGGCTALIAVIMNTSAIAPKIDAFEDALFKNNSFLPNLTIYVPTVVLEDGVATDNYGKFWNACSTRYDEESGKEIIEYVMVKEATPTNLEGVR